MKIVGKTDFSDQFKKIVTCYTKIDYVDILLQTACMIVNPIMFDNFASLFDCTLVGWSSD